MEDRDGAESPAYAAELAGLGLNLLLQRKGSEGEAVWRPCLRIRPQNEPDAWTRFNAESMLGAALLQQDKHAAAEPLLLLQGYKGMRVRQARIPPGGKARLIEVLQSLVHLYDAWGKKDQAEQWRKRGDEAKSATERPARP